MLKTVQHHDNKLDEIIDRQERLELALGSQQVLIEKILSRFDQLEENNEKFADVKEKGKGKAKSKKGEFYQVNIHATMIFLHILVTYKYLCYRTRLKS